MCCLQSKFKPVTLLPPANKVCEGYVFTGVCLSTLGGMSGSYSGGCVVLFGGCVVLFGGHAWFYLGGMHGFIWGACMVLFGGMCGFLGGHAWFFWGVCVVFSGDMHGFIRGACMVLFGGMCGFLGGMHGFFGRGVCGFFSFSDTMRYSQ